MISDKFSHSLNLDLLKDLEESDEENDLVLSKNILVQIQQEQQSFESLNNLMKFPSISSQSFPHVIPSVLIVNCLSYLGNRKDLYGIIAVSKLFYFLPFEDSLWSPFISPPLFNDKTVETFMGLFQQINIAKNISNNRKVGNKSQYFGEKSDASTDYDPLTKLTSNSNECLSQKEQMNNEKKVTSTSTWICHICQLTQALATSIQCEMCGTDQIINNSTIVNNNHNTTEGGVDNSVVSTTNNTSPYIVVRSSEQLAELWVQGRKDSFEKENEGIQLRRQSNGEYLFDNTNTENTVLTRTNNTYTNLTLPLIYPSTTMSANNERTINDVSSFSSSGIIINNTINDTNDNYKPQNISIHHENDDSNAQKSINQIFHWRWHTGLCLLTTLLKMNKFNPNDNNTAIDGSNNANNCSNELSLLANKNFMWYFQCKLAYLDNKMRIKWQSMYCGWYWVCNKLREWLREYLIRPQNRRYDNDSNNGREGKVGRESSNCSSIIPIVTPTISINYIQPTSSHTIIPYLKKSKNSSAQQNDKSNATNNTSIKTLSIQYEAESIRDTHAASSTLRKALKKLVIHNWVLCYESIKDELILQAQAVALDLQSLISNLRLQMDYKERNEEINSDVQYNKGCSSHSEIFNKLPIKLSDDIKSNNRETGLRDTINLPHNNYDYQLSCQNFLISLCNLCSIYLLWCQDVEENAFTLSDYITKDRSNDIGILHTTKDLNFTTGLSLKTDTPYVMEMGLLALRNHVLLNPIVFDMIISCIHVVSTDIEMNKLDKYAVVNNLVQPEKNSILDQNQQQQREQQPILPLSTNQHSSIDILLRLYDFFEILDVEDDTTACELHTRHIFQLKLLNPLKSLDILIPLIRIRNRKLGQHILSNLNEEWENDIDVTNTYSNVNGPNNCTKQEEDLKLKSVTTNNNDRNKCTNNNYDTSLMNVSSCNTSSVQMQGDISENIINSNKRKRNDDLNDQLLIENYHKKEDGGCESFIPVSRQRSNSVVRIHAIASNDIFYDDTNTKDLRRKQFIHSSICSFNS